VFAIIAAGIFDGLDGRLARLLKATTQFGAELDGFVKDVEKIVRQEGAIYGEYPDYEPGHYTFLADYLPYADVDGMEHRNSTVITAPGSIAASRGDLLDTADTDDDVKQTAAALAVVALAVWMLWRFLPALAWAAVLAIAIRSRLNILICGGTGTGKTHLMTALCVQACRQRRRTRFISAASLINELVEAQRNGQLSRALNRWKQWELLAIDLCEVASNVELSAGSAASLPSGGAQLHI